MRDVGDEISSNGFQPSHVSDVVQHDNGASHLSEGRRVGEENALARAEHGEFGGRGDSLLALLHALDELGRTPLYDVACELEKVLGERIGSKGVYANVDFYSGIVYERMGIPSDMMTAIYAVARTVGWLAHWLEQLEHNRLFRPTQVYEGDRGLRYVPIDKRG